MVGQAVAISEVIAVCRAKDEGSFVVICGSMTGSEAITVRGDVEMCGEMKAFWQSRHTISDEDVY